MSRQDQAKDLAVAVPQPATARRSRDTVTIPLRVENLGVAFHPGTRVRFSYRNEATGTLVLVDGALKKITRGAPGSPVVLKVDRLFYAVPAGTLISVEARELR